MFLEGHLMAGEVQILCLAGRCSCMVCRDAGLLLGVGSPSFIWKHADWANAAKEREACLTYLVAILGAGILPPT